MGGPATERVDASPDRRRRARAVGMMMGLIACGGVVWQSSHAVFTGNTSNGTNTLGAGTVTITDNDSGSAMFNLPTIAPGDTGTVCMGVQYTGSLTPTAIRLYTSGAQEANNGGAYGAWANDATSEMDDNVTMQIEVSGNDLNADPANACAPVGVGSFTNVAAVAPGTVLQTLLNTHTTYANGLPSQWGTIVANKWRVFKFTYTLPSSAPTSAQGDGVKFNIVWEAQR